MRRLFIVLSVFLFLFSCSPQLAVQQIATRNILVDAQNSVNDSLVQLVISPYRDSIQADMSKLVAVSETSIVRGKPESKLTNLVADILLETGIKFCQQTNQDIMPVASYANYGGLRGSLPKGLITIGNVFELLPFENEIVILKISGEAILKMAERIAVRGGEGLAGIVLGIRDGKVSTLKIGGKSVDPVASYWLVTNDYVASGGDQMSMFLNPDARLNTKMKIRDVMIQSLSDRYKRDGIISVKEDGRIYNEQ
jgi:2',3'-cyclic-nucleotide 2'-phosphodiesterase (5'-nucleotidase family)